MTLISYNGADVAVWSIGGLASILMLYALWILILPGMILPINPSLYVIGLLVSILIVIGIVITALNDEKR